jgi:transposase-like protein
LAVGAGLCTGVEQTLRPHLKPTNKSHRIDEIYIKVKGEDKYLYRALDSSGQKIDFLLTAKRDETRRLLMRIVLFVLFVRADNATAVSR